ncbi:MAG: glutathione peroxidase [Bacteroidetes bacterium]|nr:MAG: glutathione peroxidase [Bacteroidota bacterium]
MTLRQRILKIFYPLTAAVRGISKKNNQIKMNPSLTDPEVSFYDLHATSNNGQKISMSQFKGKKLLVVNTASDCGFTPQYEDLQKLYDDHKDKLTILGFPANDFGEQEKGDDQEIANFCKINYGVNFPLMSKSHVIKGADQNEIFEWLSNKNKNGWNDQQPTWNFTKYLLDENGRLTHYFDPSVSPSGEEIQAAIQHA